MKANIQMALAFVHHIACTVSESQITHIDNQGVIEFQIAKEGSIIETVCVKSVYDVALEGIKHAYPTVVPEDLTDDKGLCHVWTVGRKQYIELEQIKGDGVYLRLADRN